ncbi:uncharacterized protein [Ptychodera flava]|uniref:uncharacterized protein isoform X2 n=1 Tax=Ptychodera flava TaxID=63121 RepID=UPI003969DE94
MKKAMKKKKATPFKSQAPVPNFEESQQAVQQSYFDTSNLGNVPESNVSFEEPILQSNVYEEAPVQQSNKAPSRFSIAPQSHGNENHHLQHFVPPPPPPRPPSLARKSQPPLTERPQKSKGPLLKSKARPPPLKLKKAAVYESDDEDDDDDEDYDDDEQLFSINTSNNVPPPLPFSAGDLKQAKVKIGKAVQLKELRQQASKTVDFTRVDLLRKLDADVTSYIPIHRMMEVAKSSMPGNVMRSKMSFYGIEQTTDMVIKTWLDNWGQDKSSHLVSLIMHGCVNITDDSVEWIAKACPNLETVIFSGCRNLTDRSLMMLLSKCTKLEYVSLVGTAITSIPEAAGSLKYLSIKGCPIHTPMKDLLEPKEVDVATYVKNYYQDNKWTRYSAYKMVVTGLCGGKKSELINQMGLTFKEKGKMCNIHGNWVPRSKQNQDKQMVYNVIDANDQCTLDLFTSERYVFIVTCDLNDAKAAEKCVSCIGKIAVQAVHAFFVIVATHEGKDDESTKAKTLLQDILSLMEKRKTELHAMKAAIDNKPELADFQTQLMYGRIQSVMSSSPHFEVYDINPVSGQGMDKLHDGLANLKDKIDETFPHLVKFSKEFVEEAENFLKVPAKTARKIVPFSDYDFFFGGREQLMTLRTANVHDKILETLHLMGKLLYFKDVEDKPVIFDVDWFMKIINTLVDVSPGGKVGTLSEFGEQTPVLSFELIQQKLSGFVPNDQINDVVTLMQDLGLCMKLSYFKHISSDEDKFTNVPIVMYQALQSDTPQILSHYWSDIPSKTEKRIQRSFQCGGSLPERLCSCIFEQCSVFGNVLLCWKKGLLIQQGAIDILIQVKDNGRVYLSCCTLKKDTLIETMYRTFNVISTAITGVISRYSPHIAMFVNVACPSCVETTPEPEEFSMDEIKHLQGTKQCGKCGQFHRKEDLLSPEKTKVCLVHNWDDGPEDPSAAFRSDLTCAQLRQTLQTQENCAIVGQHYSQRNVKRRKTKACVHCGTSEYCSAILHKLYHGSHRAHIIQTASVGKDKFVEKEIDRAQTGNIFNHAKDDPVRIITGMEMNALEFSELSVLVLNCLRIGNVEIGFSRTGTIHQFQHVQTGDILTCKLIRELDKDSNEFIGKAIFLKNGAKVGENRVTDGRLSTPFFTLSGNDKLTVMIYSPVIPVWSSLSLQFETGMRLEALDRKNPHLTCVATIDDINDKGELLIHFDGWGRNFDYWCEQTDKDIHPLGYCDHVGIDLQEPRGYSGQYRKRFTWKTYLEDIKAVAVPYLLFTKEQTKGSPQILPEVEGSVVINRTSGSSDFKCDGSYRLMGAIMTQLGNQWRFLTDYWKKDVQNINKQHECSHGAFVFLPRNVNDTMAKHPCRQLVHASSSHDLHLLCDGTSFREMHLMDRAGIPVSEDIDFMSSDKITTGFFLSATMMSFHKTFIPKYASLFPDVSAATTRVQLESAIHKLMYVYALTLFAYWTVPSPDDKEKKADKSRCWNPDAVESILWKHYGLSTPTAEPAAQPKRKGPAKMKKKALKRLESELELNVAQLQSPQTPTQDLETIVKTKHGLTEQKGRFICRAHFLHYGKHIFGTITKFPSESFADYTEHVWQLSFLDQEIEELPEDIFKSFPGLGNLNMFKNKLKKIPNGIGNCKNMMMIDIGCNCIEELPDDFSDCAAKLTLLQVGYNPLKSLPKSMGKFTKLKQLKAMNTLITELPEDIGNMKELKEIQLKGNLISKLPDSLGELTELEKIDLRGIPWVPEIGQKAVFTREAFGEYFESMPALKTISAKQRHDLFLEVDIDHNGVLTSKEVTALNAKIFLMFPRLGMNETADSEYGGVPAPLFKLSNVKMLKLDYQAIRKVPDHIKGIKSLETFSIEHNPVLESLSGELGGLPLKALHLGHCPNLRTPPREIIGRGFGPTYAYLKRLLSGSVECKRTKLMMVGLGGAGKTSLVRALMSGYFYTDATYGEQITDGIDITSWTVKTPEDTLTYSVWDFAGQTVYYNTHQFFLSNRAVYLLLWNTRLGVEHSGLDFWLSSIAVHAPKAPIFVVGTHADQVAKVEVPEEELKRRYPQIAGFFLVSSVTGQGVRELQTNLLTVTLQEKYMGERIPQVWLNFEKQIIAQRKNTSLLPWKTVRKMAMEVAIYDDTEITQAVQFLHDLGSLQHFDNEYLKDRVVINPQWIVDVMACVVSVHESAIKDGNLLHKDIAEVWSSYDSDLHEWLLRLTEEFDLTFPLTDKPVNVVPCLLPEKEPEFQWPDIDSQPGFRETKMLYQFEYLPAGLFNRAQVRLYQFCDSSVIWKKGSMLRKNGHMALMRHLRDSNLLVQVQGPRPENVLFLVHEIFEGLITESFHGVTYDYMIPCPDCLNVGSRDPCMFTASKISRANNMKAPFLQCDHYFHTISLHELQAVMPPDSSSNFDVHLENTMRDLEDIRFSMTSDIFMLYCHDNLPKNGDNAVDPKKVKDNLEKEGYSCWLNEDQEQSNVEQVTIAMKDAQIVMAFMSNEFEKSKACRDQLSYGVNVLHKVVVPVVLGKGMEWQKTHTGMLVGKEVYINMQGGMNTFKSKMEELLRNVKNKTKKQKEKKYPRCFVSYCWHNSRRAVELKQVPENPHALGKGDPRELKEYLEKNGVTCWMDVDNVGRSGLFEDIAEGLKHADMMLACVSDEYARSKNCQMEFRFASVTLRLPLVIAVVGTGYDWEASEVGMLSLGCPKVNFQHDLKEEADELAHWQLLDFVKSNLPVQEENDSKEEEEGNVKKNLEFQELYELAQRKFLRQAAMYADSMDTQAYPRLILLDYINKEDEEGNNGIQGNGNQGTETGDATEVKNDEKVTQNDKEITPSNQESAQEREDGKDGDCNHGDESGTGAQEEAKEEKREEGDDKNKPPPDVTKDEEDETKEAEDTEEAKETAVVQSEPNLIAYLLCENEEGWHSLDEGIPICVDDPEGFLANMSPYLARILAIIKHSSIHLDLVNDQQLMKILTEKAAGTTEFSKEYKEMRTITIEADGKLFMGGLQRCQLASGRISWLCTAHQQQQGRITVLSNLLSGVAITEQEDDLGLAEHLQELMIDKKDGSFQDESNLAGRSTPAHPLPRGKPLPLPRGKPLP